MIRGRHVDDARRVLRFSQLGPNPVVLKVLDSAVANAEQRNAIPENLYVAAAWVDEGPTLKRFRPRLVNLVFHEAGHVLFGFFRASSPCSADRRRRC